MNMMISMLSDNNLLHILCTNMMANKVCRRINNTFGKYVHCSRGGTPCHHC